MTLFSVLLNTKFKCQNQNNVSCTCAVTVASCERTHSKVKIINNYLRAVVSPDSLGDLVQINSERDIADNIALSKVVDVFKLASHRKLLL